MAKHTIQSLTDIKNQSTIFDDLKKVYFCADVIDTASELNEPHTLLQLPITEDGVTLNMGGVNTTFKKLNTGEVWGSTVDRDDPEVSFNVASVSADVNAMFMGEGNTAAISINDPAKIDAEKSFVARGYALELKAVTGSLWFPSENGDGWVVLPNIKMYGGLNGTDDSNTAYFACQVTPNVNGTDKVSLYIISTSEKAAAAEAKFYTVYVTYEGGVVAVLRVKTAAEVVTAAAEAGYTVASPGSVKDKLVVQATAKK